MKLTVRSIKCSEDVLSGYEHIEDTAVKQMSRKLGKVLLPKSNDNVNSSSDAEMRSRVEKFNSYINYADVGDENSENASTVEDIEFAMSNYVNGYMNNFHEAFGEGLNWTVCCGGEYEVTVSFTLSKYAPYLYTISEGNSSCQYGSSSPESINRNIDNFIRHNLYDGELDFEVWRNSKSSKRINSSTETAINPSTNIQASTAYEDTNGIMGEPGDVWTYEELYNYWESEQLNDPCLAEYPDFDSWVTDTISNMTSINSATNIQASNSEAIKEEIYSEVSNMLVKVMMSPEFGFEEAEALNYSGVNVKETDDGRICVEVWAEVSYDGLVSISNELDTVIQYYDADAYFDMEDSGRMSAYLELKNNITSSTVEGAYENDMFPGTGDYVPPENDYSIDIEDEEDGIEVTLNAIVTVDDDGNWEYEDTTYRWARSPRNDGNWYSDEHRVYMNDAPGVTECVDELIVGMMPAKPGRYRIKGDVWLKYNIVDLQGYMDDDGEIVVWEDCGTAEWDKEESTVDNFTFKKL